jgi:hypothetical protein
VEFLEELDWELQAFCKANTKLELSGMPTDRRQAADRVDATAHHARQVVERVLWEYNCRWRESCGNTTADGESPETQAPPHI